ncbi:hypothetical protein GCM10027063_38240 [Promicromonospora xylanilytica]
MRREKYRPASRQRAISGIDQISSFAVTMLSAKLMVLLGRNIWTRARAQTSVSATTHAHAPPVAASDL